uniref:NAD(P)H dehydrogenase, quinone 1 n=1 Tax=Astyanax mexicanus TaxID=7994 RepID=A0A8B9KWU7_ASTMX
MTLVYTTTITSPQPFTTRKNVGVNDPEHFVYNDEACAAWKEGRLSDDIKEEHNKLLEADLVIFQFPMYWFSVPGIMKGWIDRVLTQGFAFSLQNMYDNGIFKDKKALLSFTTGGPESMYLPDGINGDINIMLYPLQSGVLHFCGFQVLAPQIFWSVCFYCSSRKIQLLIYYLLMVKECSCCPRWDLNQWKIGP